MKTDSPVELNPGFEGTIGRPRIVLIVVALVLLIAFGFFVHGVDKLDARKLVKKEGTLTRKIDDIEKPAPTTTTPQFAQHDPAVAPIITTIAVEEEPEFVINEEVSVNLFTLEFTDIREDPDNLILAEESDNIVTDVLTSESSSPSNLSPHAIARKAFLKRYYADRTNNKFTRTSPPPEKVEVSPDNTAGRNEINDILGNIQTPPPPLLPVDTPDDIQRYDLQNAVADKVAFASTTQGGIYNKQPPHSALSPLILRQGTILPFILERRANSDLPGHLQAMIPDDIYDSVQNLALLIPKGSRVVLEYNPNIRFGQQRLQMSARRLLLPNHTSVLLDGATVYDGYGQSGLGEPDIKINNHYDELLKSGLLSGLLNYATNSVEQEAGNDILGSLAESLGESTETAGEIILRRTLDRQPTLTAEIGTTGFILLTRDLILPPYYQN